ERFHHHRANLGRLDLILARGLELTLNPRNEPFDARPVDRPLAAGDLDAAHQFFAVEGLAGAPRLEHRDFAQLDSLEGGETRAAILALATAADRGAILGRTAVLHLTVFVAAVGTAHGSALHPAKEGDGRPGEMADRPADRGKQPSGDRSDECAGEHGARRGMVSALLSH